MYGFNGYNFGNIPQGNNMQGNNGMQHMNIQQDERVFVSNQQAAESYIVAANGFVRLWDSSQPKFYEKSADYTGRPMPMKIFEYKEVSAMPEMIPTNFVSTEEFTEFKDQVNDFIKSFEVKEVKKNAKQSNANNADA